MIRAFESTHRIVAKKSALLVSPKGRRVGLFSRRLTRGGAFREEEEEEGENMSAIPKGGEEEEEHKVTPEFPKGEEYPSGMDDTQSSFATWEFAQGPFHGKRGFLVTSMFPGSVRVFLFFSFSWKNRRIFLIRSLYLNKLNTVRRRLSSRLKKVRKYSTTRTSP